MIDGTMWKKGRVLFIFASSFRCTRDRIYKKWRCYQKSQQRLFTLFFFAVADFETMWTFSLLSSQFPKFVFLRRKFPINYKNKHFFHLVLKQKFSSMDTCITITRTLESNSREKPLEMQQNLSRRQKTKKDRIPASTPQCVSCIDSHDGFAVSSITFESSQSLAHSSRARSFQEYFPTQVSLKVPEINKMHWRQSAKRWETGHTSSHLTRQFSR